MSDEVEAVESDPIVKLFSKMYGKPKSVKTSGTPKGVYLHRGIDIDFDPEDALARIEKIRAIKAAAEIIKELIPNDGDIVNIFNVGGVPMAVSRDEIGKFESLPLTDILTNKRKPLSHGGIESETLDATIGWYQSKDGVLYRFDGKTWIGEKGELFVMEKEKMDSLEDLGG